MTLDMVDNNASHNFMRDDIVQNIGLHYEQEKNSFKAVNSGEQEIWGKAKDVSIKLGDWVGRTSFIGVPLHDYEVILGHEFLWTEKEVPILHDECSTILSDAYDKGSKEMNMSCLRLVENQQPCAYTNERSKDKFETKDWDEESEFEEL